jgi:hypothetical protein
VKSREAVANGKIDITNKGNTLDLLAERSLSSQRATVYYALQKLIVNEISRNSVLVL